jgi:hypothetical protein
MELRVGWFLSVEMRAEDVPARVLYARVGVGVPDMGKASAGWPFRRVAEELGGFGLGDDGLDAGVEAALVAAGGVLVEDTLLDALIEDGDGRAVDFDDGFLVAGGEGLAHEAKGTAELGFVGAVDGGLGDGLTGALERRYVVCHGARSLFLSGGALFRRNGGCWRRLVLNVGLA